MKIVSPALICISILLASYLIGRGFFGHLVKKGAGFAAAAGLMVLWGVFLVISIPVIIFQNDKIGMHTIVNIYAVTVPAIVLAALILSILKTVRKRKTGDKKKEQLVLDNKEIIYLSIFFALVFYQLFKAVFYAYADGDDAFYVAMSQSLSGELDALYINNPYTGVIDGLMYRYALAPFPVWIAFLSRIFKVNAATVSHICMPIALIPITYAIYNAIGEKLFAGNKEKKYIFLCLVAVFIMFSGYSFYPSEVFMLTRARQGKEALGNIVIPLLFYEMLDTASGDEWSISPKNYILIIFIALSGALTSVFGNILVLVALFGNFIYSFMRHAVLKEKIKAASLALPNLLMLALYVLL